MELKNIKENKNLVFDRKEVEVIVSAASSPSNKEVAAFLSKKLNVSEDALKINGIYGQFGSKEFKILANVYKSKEDKNKVERKTKKEVEQEKKDAEAAKAAKQEKSE